jgi:hypothetical protein
MTIILSVSAPNSTQGRDFPALPFLFLGWDRQMSPCLGRDLNFRFDIFGGISKKGVGHE